MPTETAPLDHPTPHLSRHAWLVLLVGALLSGLAWWQAAGTLQEEADARFRRETEDVRGQLARQLDHHIDLLRSYEALFLARPDLDRATFQLHDQRLHPSNDASAMQSVLWAPLVRHGERAAFEARVRADTSLTPEGYPVFAIHPAGPARDAYLPITYQAPMDGNLQAFGLDILADPVRGASVQAARDEGAARASPPFRLLLQGSPTLGLAVRLPLYERSMPLRDVAERRQAFRGVVSGVLRADALFNDVANGRDWRALRWQVRDLGPIAQLTTRSANATDTLKPFYDTSGLSALSYRGPSRGGAVASEDRLHNSVDVGGRRWSLTFTRAPVHASTQPYPLSLLLGGFTASLGLWWALRSSHLRQAQATSMAERMSRQATDSEQRLRAVLDHTTDGILSVAPSGRILSVNQAICHTFGLPSEAIVGQHLSLLLPAAGGSETGRRVERFLQAQCVGMDRIGGHRTEGQRQNGQRFPVELSVSAMTYQSQRQFIVIVRDLSHQETAERAIVEAQRQLNEVDEMRRVIVHNAPYAICVLNPAGVIQAINPAGERLLGHSAMELVGRSTTERFFDPDQIAERTQLLALRLNRPVDEVRVLAHMAKSSPGLPSEWNLVREDGRPIVAELVVTELRNEHGQLGGYLAMAHDVTSRREAEKQVQHMALHDALTGLPNRNMLQEQLKASLGLAERQHLTMAMMFLDLDRFKKINDSLGHHIGDNVLIEVARRLRAAMRTSDVVARLGGDEFVILLPRISEEADGLHVAEKVIEAFAEPLRVGPHELRVTPSIGLALYPQHGTDAITLMRHADLAMYQAKHRGRNRVQVYSEHMASPTAESLILENDLYKALEREELRLHFQPQFDCRSGRISGAEALLRWEHEGKLVAPGEFIPLAEETGLIVPMGEWVLHRACTMGQQWRQRSGWPLRIAVNLSAVQLERPDIVDVVARALRETGLPPTALELEITESVVVRESLRAADVLGQLRGLGVGIAIDDFGVGYSSFAYLRELPVDRFKLDRSFLAAVPQSAGDSRLAAALIAMAHRLEVGIVAEGVETPEQAQFLRDHQCDEAQGYLLGRPMKEEAFETLLMAHAREHGLA
ncbi:EAL domain-containing protein [Aquabacterium sp.]|uniref:bifunctional diguanylate cyclase/phosphodiesterase n=1 Tax=Aquabacterium sp. TaxID=1872578 RepID=UPI0025BA4418|nr:EAL domain-containing protein [Aquabacterium sp.]